MKVVLILVFSICSFVLNAQDYAAIISKANQLIENKKYATAYDLLDSADQKNTIPDVVLLKENILLNYFVTSIMHQMFSLADIGKNEDIMDYRKGDKEVTASIKIFSPDSVLLSLIKSHPENCKLYKGLGDFYFEIQLRYGGRWLMSDEEVHDEMEKYYLKAIEGNCGDYMSYYSLGFHYTLRQKYNEAIPYFKQSISLNKEYPSSHYNLAYVYWSMKNPESAIEYAKHALDLYADSSYKSDAARMLGQLYREMKNDEQALIYFEKANQIDPGNYYNLSSLLDVYLRTGHKSTSKTLKSFYYLAPDNPTIYNDLEEIYSAQKKEKELINFYKSQLSAHKKNYTISGNLNFYLGRLTVDSDKKSAKKYFLAAKEAFKNVFEENHPVFEVIEEGLKKCE